MTDRPTTNDQRPTTRDSLSWTQLFSDLEKIMPAELRVTVIQPALDAENRLELHMTIEGGSREKAIELLRHLEDSPRFREPQLRTEVTPQGTTGTPTMQ